jgi:hypothetical protein
METSFEKKGKVVDFTTKTGSLFLMDTNVAGENRIMVRMVNNDTKAVQECLLSSSLTKDFRAKKLTLGNIMNLDYGVNELGRYYITRPQGTWVEYKVESLNIVDMKVEEINMDDLVAL